MFHKAAHKPTTGPSSPKSGSNGISAVVTEAAPCRKSLQVRVGQDAIEPVRAAVLAEFQKTAALPGFRKGKAPIELVAREYANPIHEELLRRLTKRAFEQVTTEHDLRPVGPFELTVADFNERDGLALEAAVEVEPSFPLGSYKGIPLTQEPVELTAGDVDKALAALQESAAQLVPTGEGGAKERKLPALDDELAKDLGFGGLSQLRAHVEAKLLEQRRTAHAQRMESNLCEELLKRHAFEVPPGLVSRQADRLTRDFKVRLLLAGTPEEQLNEEVAKFTAQLRTSAERHVKLAFILERIATQESIAVTQDELVGRLWQLAQRWKKDPAEVRKILDAQQLWPSVASAIRQEKTITFLMSAAAINSAHSTAV
ncbi:MAG: trigger factor [Candidatus Omnitrophica bacterium]|nr:trigger factor [Candidatus Omnitrophota bacterium]